jgi:DNA-binding transcriptional ArsR family regulator
MTLPDAFAELDRFVDAFVFAMWVTSFLQCAPRERRDRAGRLDDLTWTIAARSWRCFSDHALLLLNRAPTPGMRGAFENLLQSALSGRILNCMVQYSTGLLSASFAALSDATRRGILQQLGRADASITDLAQAFHMTLTGMKKHVGVLEQAGLVTTEKVGRVRTCTLGPRRLEDEAAWIERYRQLWDARFDELDNVVEELQRKEKVDGRTKRE